MKQLNTMTTQHTAQPLIVCSPYTNRIAYPIGYERPDKAVQIIGEASNQADALLWANASNMLKALEAIEAILDGRQPKDVPGAVMVARSAIAKARGQ